MWKRCHLDTLMISLVWQCCTHKERCTYFCNDPVIRKSPLRHDHGYEMTIVSYRNLWNQFYRNHKKARRYSKCSNSTPRHFEAFDGKIFSELSQLETESWLNISQSTGPHIIYLLSSWAPRCFHESTKGQMRKSWRPSRTTQCGKRVSFENVVIVMTIMFASSFPHQYVSSIYAIYNSGNLSTVRIRETWVFRMFYSIAYRRLWTWNTATYVDLTLNWFCNNKVFPNSFAPILFFSSISDLSRSFEWPSLLSFIFQCGFLMRHPPAIDVPRTHQMNESFTDLYSGGFATFFFMCHVKPLLRSIRFVSAIYALNNVLWRANVPLRSQRRL